MWMTHLIFTRNSCNGPETARDQTAPPLGEGERHDGIAAPASGAGARLERWDAERKDSVARTPAPQANAAQPSDGIGG